MSEVYSGKDKIRPETILISSFAPRKNFRRWKPGAVFFDLHCWFQPRENTNELSSLFQIGWMLYTLNYQSGEMKKKNEREVRYADPLL